jgi:HlyD family secretion protein
VDELDIQKVKAGQKAEIKLGAIADKVYEGTVEEIALTGTTSNNVTTYDVVVAISNPESVKLGMNANVSILVESKENILVIPAEALVERNGSKFVMVADSTNTSNSSSQQANTEAGGNGGKQTQNNNQSTGNSQGMTANGRQGVNSGNRTANAGGATASSGKLVAIKTGIENQNYIEVTEGLTEGQQILVSLPQTSTSTNQSTRNTFSTGVGGFGGGAGVMGGNRQQAPTGNGGGNRQ